MSNGPITQFWKSDNPRTLKLLKTSFSSSYLTFASGGYIITIRPMAMGMLVVPELMEFQKWTIPGKIYPVITPVNMARNIHKVRYLSRKESFFKSELMSVIIFWFKIFRV